MNQTHFNRVKSIIEKVQIFQGFSVSEAQRFIRLCRPKSYKKKEVVYEWGTPSTDMFIVLQGKLVAINQEGMRLSEIFPGATTGEMGVLTGNRRSATVITEEDTCGLVIEASHLKRLMRLDSEIRVKVLENMVGQLCERVMSTSAQLGNSAHENRYQTKVA